MLRKIEGRRRGRQRMRWLDGIMESRDVSLSKPGDAEGQGSLVCCSPWGHGESDTTEWLDTMYILTLTHIHSIAALSSIQSFSCVQLFATPCQASLSITNSWSLLKPMSIELAMPCNHLILCRPLLLLPSIFPSIRVFSKESVLRIRWPKYWSFSFNISLSNEHPGLISFRMDWLDLLTVQGTLKSLHQYHSSKASNSLALSFLYSPTLTPTHDYWKNHSLTRRTLSAK